MTQWRRRWNIRWWELALIPCGMIAVGLAHVILPDGATPRAVVARLLLEALVTLLALLVIEAALSLLRQRRKGSRTR